ncbi:MAG TPA: hypothetical protein VFD62_16225 [Pyrinomonadaceae bacterium]|nr:hypothetical protein [Pyrinomonadaceae bacterium]
MSNGLRRVRVGRITPGARQKRYPFENHTHVTNNYSRPLHKLGSCLFIE